MEINDPANWCIIDPHPGLALDRIPRISDRAAALLSRRTSYAALQGEVIRLCGAVDMLGALDYHFDNLLAIRSGLENYVRVLQELKITNEDVKPGEQRILDHELVAKLTCDSDKRLFRSAKYEAVAYISRLGQFWYFAKSSFVTTRIGPVALNTIERLLPFRHKFAAHRSIDKPRGEPAELQTLQAMSLAIGGMIWHPLGCGRQVMLFQIRTTSTDVENFVPEEDHLLVMYEAYDVLSRILN